MIWRSFFGVRDISEFRFLRKAKSKKPDPDWKLVDVNDSILIHVCQIPAVILGLLGITIMLKFENRILVDLLHFILVIIGIILAL